MLFQLQYKSNTEQIIKGLEEEILRFDMNCALVHPALMFELSLPHMMLIYCGDEDRRFL
jgi:hypothetical protein